MKKQGVDFLIEFGSDHAKFPEKLGVFCENTFEFFENCAKTESHTTSIANEIFELRQKIMSMDERNTEINDFMTRKQ